MGSKLHGNYFCSETNQSESADNGGCCLVDEWLEMVLLCSSIGHVVGQFKV